MGSLTEKYQQLRNGTEEKQRIEQEMQKQEAYYGNIIDRTKFLDNKFEIDYSDHGISFAPGTNGLNAPYGMTSVKGFVYYPVQWIESFDDEYDWAVFKTSSAIGNKCGWLGTKVTTDGNLTHQMSLIIGYPIEHWGDNGYAEQWFGEKEMHAVTATKLFYDVDTSGGQSGSPIIQYQEDDIYAVGVHAYRTGATALFPQYNSGSRITMDFMNMIKYYLNQ